MIDDELGELTILTVTHPVNCSIVTVAIACY